MNEEEIKINKERQERLDSFVGKNREYIFLFFVLWSLASYLLLGVLAKGDEIIYFAKERSEVLNAFFIFCSYIGEGYVYVAATVFFMFVAYSKSIAITINASLVLLVTGVLKVFFGHERPIRYFNDLLKQPELPNYIPDLTIHDGWTTSFPSGHTTAAFAFYTLLAFFIPNKWLKLACLLCAVLVGVSRIYLVQHFLKDVTTGMLTGFFIALFVYWLHERYLYRWSGNLKHLINKKTP